MVAANLTANIVNSDGIAVLEVNGDSGDGKSHAAATAAEQMGQWCDMSGMSPMALLYHAGKTIFEGMMVILDDNRPNDTQADIVKRNQTKFKTGYTYKTVDAQRMPLVAHIPPGVQIMSTQVDARDEDEVIKRTLMLEVKGSVERDQKIIDNDLKRAETAEQPLNDPEILVCQCALDMLKAHKFRVTIPGASRRIRWHERSKNGRLNVRNFKIFLDLVYGYAVMRYRVRDHNVRDDGTIEVVATRQDFMDALSLYMTIHKQMATKLTSKEGDLLKLIGDAGGKLLREDALKKLGITDGRLSQLINGKDGRGGLRGKCIGFYVEQVSESPEMDVSEPEDYSTKKATHNYLCLADPINSQDTIGNMPAEWVEDGSSPSNPDQDAGPQDDQFTRLPSFTPGLPSGESKADDVTFTSLPLKESTSKEKNKSACVTLSGEFSSEKNISAQEGVKQGKKGKPSSVHSESSKVNEGKRGVNGGQNQSAEPKVNEIDLLRQSAQCGDLQESLNPSEDGKQELHAAAIEAFSVSGKIDPNMVAATSGFVVDVVIEYLRGKGYQEIEQDGTIYFVTSRVLSRTEVQTKPSIQAALGENVLKKSPKPPIAATVRTVAWTGGELDD